MRYFLVCASIFVLAGCGSFTNSDVESDVVIDAPVDTVAPSDELSARQNDEFFAPLEDNRLDLEGDDTTTETALNPDSETSDDVEVQVEVFSDQAQEREDSTVDVTQQVVESISNKISPVTGPAIPEEEMRKILERN